MSETPEQSNDPTGPVATTTATLPPAVPPADPVVVEQKPNRLYQAAAWVAIVAGSLFIVGVVFFSGFVLGRHSGGGHWDGGRHHEEMFERGGPQMGPMMRPGGPGGPGFGQWGPPGMFGPGPGNQGPGQTPPTAQPTR